MSNKKGYINNKNINNKAVAFCSTLATYETIYEV